MPNPLAKPARVVAGIPRGFPSGDLPQKHRPGGRQLPPAGCGKIT